MGCEVVQSLPGFAGWVDSTRRDRAGGEDLSDGKRWTAERLKLCHPGVYEAVGRGLFYWQMPISALADICRVSRKTVAAIRDRAIVEAHASGATDPAALFCIKSRIRGQKDIIKARIVEEILDRLSDPDKVKGMDTMELVAVLAKIEDKQPPAVQQQGQKPASEAKFDESGMMFDDAINGLGGGEKSAAKSFVNVNVTDGYGDAAGTG